MIPQRIIFGRGSINKIGEEAKRLGAGRVLIVTSKGMLKRESLKWVTDSLQEHQLGFEVFPRVDPEPPIEDAHDCVTFAKETRSDLLIGLGGGSVMDVAKKVASDLGLPKIMMPTTAGTGSEVTHESVLKVNGQKQAFVDESLVSDIAIVDPDLTSTMTPRLTVTSGMDALAHAIECYESKRSNPLARTLALKAYKIIKDNLRKAVNREPEARVNMSLASLMAGMAFGNSGTTLCHALSYPLSNEGISHGEAVAIILPYALEFNNFDQEVINEVKGLISDLNISVRFRSDIREMAEVVMEDARHLSNNPREVKLEDVIDIYHRLKQENR